ncbi:MAG: 3-phosphoshikimate 1-carboxyvinyltransferase, partial [Thermodesulfovibrionales bacterium]
MTRIKLNKARALKGELAPPPDKSITHRAIMFASFAEGKSIIRNPLMAEDPINTINAMRMLGVEITEVRAEKSELRSKNSKLITHNSEL